MEFQVYNVIQKKKRKKERENKVTKIIKKKNWYKIDNKYQKAKIKNLEQSSEFQKYNVKRRKRKREKGKKSHKNYKENIGTKLITNTKKHKLKI